MGKQVVNLTIFMIVDYRFFHVGMQPPNVQDRWVIV